MMDKKMKSIGCSTIEVTDSEIRYDEKGKQGVISIAEITRFEVTEGSFSEFGRIVIEENGNEHRVGFVSTFNKEMRATQRELGFENQNEPENVKQAKQPKEKKPYKSLAQIEAEMPDSWKEKQAEKARVEQMKKDKIPFCPKCHSTSVTYLDKKLSIGRAIVGGAVAGGVGAVLGGVSSKGGRMKCLNCGKEWKI